jgi:hypothetical protein
MDNSLSPAQINILRKQAQKAKEIEFLKACKQRLETIICKKIETATIGSLAAIEKYLGYLWGTSKNRTSEELEMFDIWQQLRKEILDNGNNQIRGAKAELENQTIIWNGYQLTLPVKEHKDG